MNSTESLPQTEADTTRRLLETLPELLPGLKVVAIRREAMVGPGAVADVVATARTGNLSKQLIFEIKSLGEPRMAEQAVMQLRRLARSRPDAYLVFVAPYVSERSREILRSEGIGYLDLVGDAFLRFGSVLVDRVGEGGRPFEKRSLKTLFAPKATRVIRTLLQNPRDPVTITQLSKTCGMSPAGVYFVVDLLDTKGFVTREKDRSIVLSEPERLLREWAKNWSWEKSRKGYYFSFDKTSDQIVTKVSEATKRLGLEYALTGMAGASYVAPFVRYSDVSFYLNGSTSQLVKELDWRPVTSGANVVILDPYDVGVFAGARVIRGTRVVSDIQLFVDLYNYPARGQEQAEALYDKVIKFPRRK